MARFFLGAILAVSAVCVAAQAGFARAVSAARTCPLAAAPAPNPSVRLKPVGSITIQSIGVNAPIFQGRLPDIKTEASKTLNNGPAFYPQNMRFPNGQLNSLPGQGGTVAMLGHRTTRTHPFCFVANLKRGDLAIIKMRYGTFVYREIAHPSLPGNDWSAFDRPAQYDPHPKSWNKGIQPEYIVAGACDPPHSAARRVDAIFKLVAIRG